MRKLDEYYRESPSLYGDNPETKRKELLDYFLTTFELFEKLFEPIASPQAFYKAPDAQRHPIIFYYGHTAAFYINKLILAKELDERINTEFESMFAIGVDEMSWDDMDSSHYDWPGVQAVKAYRDEVKAVVLNLIQSKPLSMPIGWESPFWWTLLMGIEHERIHLETSSVLHRQLDIADVVPGGFWDIYRDGSEIFPKNGMVTFDGREVHLGKNIGDDYYGWDNEYGVMVEAVSDFEAAQYLTSNGEFLDFVEAGGYSNPDFWCEEGWRWLEISKRRYPKFWIVNSEGRYEYRTMLQQIPMPWNWPVEVNYHEAKAFCRFLSAKDQTSYRLPTEAEWYLMAQDEGVAQKMVGGNIGLMHAASSCAVDRYKFGRLYDVIGNVWQWSESTITGFRGFRTHPFYDDFSTPTFDGLHNLIKGGSWISTGNEALLSSRYAFRRHFMQHAGFRYIKGDAMAQIDDTNSYESDTQVAQYCDFHYGPNHFGVPNYAKSLVDIALQYTDEHQRNKALDLGCAVGRASFELAPFFKEVTGIDFSARFIQVGTHLKEAGEIKYERVVEGDITQIHTVHLRDFNFARHAPKVSFHQGDACNLKSHFKGYDLVLAANLIDRLYEPETFLESMAERINSGGILIISSPYTWLEEYTAKVHWLGAKVVDGQAIRSYDALKHYLEKYFVEIADPCDIPFVIRETERKFQHTVAQVTVWRRK